jgi:hypothetical protein
MRSKLSFTQPDMTQWNTPTATPVRLISAFTA